MNSYNIPAAGSVVQPQQFGDVVAGHALEFRPSQLHRVERAHEIPFSVLAKNTGTFSKTFAIGPTGAPGKIRDSDRAADTAARVTLNGTPGAIAQQFASRLRDVRANEALVLAPPPAGRDLWKVLPKKELGERSDAIARTKDFFLALPGPAIMGLDFDAKEWPSPIRERVRSSGGVLNVLKDVFPDMANAIFVRRPSVSCGIRNTATGQQTPSENGAHWYFFVTAGSEIREFAQRLHDRLVLAGYGFGFVSKAGVIHIRSLIDVTASLDASRLWYEADAELTDPRLRYIDGARSVQIENEAGGLLELSRLADLSDDGKERLDAVAVEITKENADAAARARSDWQLQRRSELVAKGWDPAKAERVTGSATTHELVGEFELALDDGVAVTVDEILDDPARFHKATCPDPLEPEYGAGRNLAIIYTDGGRARIMSHAHGRTLYRLSRSAEHWLEQEADNVVLFPTSDESVHRLAHIRPMVTVRQRPDGRTISTRKWLIEPRYPIGDVTQIVGEPGISKSSFAILDALIVASGDERLLRGEGRTAPERLYRSGPVVIYNAEDSTEEMRRRLTAGMRHYAIDELAHPIHLWSGVDGEVLTIMERRDGNRGPVKRAAGADLLINRIRETGTVLAFLDPQVSLSLGLQENDTGDMNALLQELATIAAAEQVAIAVIHHTAKHTRGAAGDMGAGRGSFAVAGKVRSMLTLTNIATADAEAWGVDAETHVRLDYAKASHGRMPRSPLLLKRCDVSVGNGIGATAGTVFEETPAEMLRRQGDRAPVIEVVGPASAVPASGPSDAERRACEDTSIARAALTAMAGETPVRIADIRAQLMKAVNDAGISRAKSANLISSIVTSALCLGGVVLEHEGQIVRVRAFQEGRGPKAPWFLEVSKPTDKLSGRVDENDGSLGNAGAFS